MPGLQIQKGTTYVNYGTPGQSQVTAENLNNHVDNAVLLPGAISAQIEDVAQISDYVIVERTNYLFKYALSSIRDLFSTVFLSKSGGSMTGPLTLNANPTAALGAATKQYVDTSAAGATLVGAVVMWGGSTIPAGWLEMNGQASPLSLVPIYGATLPDLRGEFVRGWDNGRGVDGGRQLRSAQGQDIQPHTHAPPVGYQYVTNPFTGDGEIDGSNHTGQGERNASAIASAVNAGAETRPRNVALRFIVKT
jgi:hypothetical protein